jgi:D-lactate dehydrogenase (cytochrome)
MTQWGVKTSYLTCFAGSEFVIEPRFYWHDQLSEFRPSLIEPEFAAKWRDIPENEARRKVAPTPHDQPRDLFDCHGGMHLRLGKYQPYTEIMNNPALPKVIHGVKELLDPKRLVKPGLLGSR